MYKKYFGFEEAPFNATAVSRLETSRRCSRTSGLKFCAPSREKLLPIVLVGQPELRARLDDPRLRQVRQRIALRYQLDPLPRAQIEAFIRHRLRVVGRRTRLFSPDAIRRIAIYTRGIPRLINILCHAGLFAYAADADMVSGRMIDEAAADLLLTRRGKARKPRWLTGVTLHTRVKRTLGRHPQTLRLPTRWRWVVTGTAALLVGIAAGSALGPGAPLMGYVADVGQRLTELLPREGQSSTPADEQTTPSELDAAVGIRGASIVPARRRASAMSVDSAPRHLPAPPV